VSERVERKVAGNAARWNIAEETAVALAYDGETATVMMATPADLEDFARGLSLTEGYIENVSDIAEITVAPAILGIVVEVKLRDGKGTTVTAKRSIAGRSGCGICGVDSLEAAMRPPKKLLARSSIDAAAVTKAFAELAAHQPLNRSTHSVHAAAWATRDGKIQLAREDVGRHNALDKLIGALAISTTRPSDGFIVMSSRCSYELVVKAAAAGVPLLATVSAPTGLALDFAYACGMTLAARAKDGVMIFDPRDPATTASQRNPEPLKLP
jgi:FdhD protein